MAEYTENVVANTRIFAERAREIVEQEIDRAKSLDTKAGATTPRRNMDDPREQTKNQGDQEDTPEQDEPIFPMPDLDLELREGLEEEGDSDE